MGDRPFASVAANGTATPKVGPENGEGSRRVSVSEAAKLKLAKAVRRSVMS
jgi:hypothetical protein